jgi:dephospho-CoA kinase
MLQVGLTGNIASGKSNASRVFAELGAHVVDADIIAHKLLDPGTATYGRIRDAFGAEILFPDGTINRKVLGRIVFSQADKRVLLNGLIHPDVRAEVLRRVGEVVAREASAIIIVDAALMVESGFYKLHERLIVVYCDPALQLSRLMARDGLLPSEAKARMDAQLPVEEKLKLADYVIETSGTFRETRVQIETVYRDLVRVESDLRPGPS